MADSFVMRKKETRAGRQAARITLTVLSLLVAEATSQLCYQRCDLGRGCK